MLIAHRKFQTGKDTFETKTLVLISHLQGLRIKDNIVMNKVLARREIHTTHLLMYKEYDKLIQPAREGDVRVDS